MKLGASSVQGQVDRIPACELCLSLNASGRMQWVEREHLGPSLMLRSMGSHNDVFQCLLGHLQFRKVLSSLTLELLKIIIGESLLLCGTERFTCGSSLECHKAVGLGEEVI